MELIYWDNHYNLVLLLNLAIVIGIFTSVRLFSGVLSKVNAEKELTQKDNSAFGISMAGMVVAVSIILAGAIYGDPIFTMEESVISVGLYGMIGVILMALSRIIFGKIALPSVKVRDEIVKGNVAAGVIDAGNVIATAIIIRSIMMWVDANTVEGIVAILAGFLILQLLLGLTSFLRIKRFDFKVDETLQAELKSGNTAIALRFAGGKIGAAFAIASASNRLIIENYELPALLAIWAGVSIVMIIILTILSFIASKIIFAKIAVDDEIIRQRNVALGAVQCVVNICLGFLLCELML